MQDTNSVQNPEVTSPVQIEQPKKSNFLVVLLSVLLLFSISIAAFFAYQTQKLSDELRVKNSDLKIVSTPTQDPVSTDVPKVDPTSNWKTYTGKLFSFKYPVDARLEVQQDGVVKIMYMGQKQIDSGRTQTSLFDGYGFFVSSQNETLTLEEVYQKRVENFGNACDPDKMGKLQSSTIDGYKAVYYDSSCLGDYTTYLVINKDDILFELVELYVGDSADQVVYKKVVDQILSTFKFIN